ncbi:hypothetical protein ACMFMF_002842 [Clarireedia jacksonii]
MWMQKLKRFQILNWRLLGSEAEAAFNADDDGGGGAGGAGAGGGDQGSRSRRALFLNLSLTVPSKCSTVVMKGAAISSLSDL